MNGSCCAFDEPILNVVLPPMLLLEFILGLLGNILGLWMICCDFKSWKPNSVYLFSLTLADIVVVFSVLFRADYYLRHQHWVYGDIPCRLLLYILAAARAAGMIFLSLIALNRYCKILFPFHRVNNITVNQAGCICVTLWIFIFAMHSYILKDPHFFKLNNGTQCESFNICPQSLIAWQDAFYISVSCLSLLTISYCTVSIALHLKDHAIDTNGKVGRAMTFIVLIATVFFVCFVPSATVRVAIWVLKSMKYEDCASFRNSSLAFYLTICLTYFYSMLNPMLYYFSSPSSHTVLTKLWNNKEFKSSGPH
ncbi:PREDICTED: hydroxycarboxylic acid receptor 2-like [Nanorana parkeri]|uniref:hydroxycarboxylic acid receptor 2-like n=1 Tax=Nanorana parkeri TaxID=125878 RepID=UPI0008544C08|nr:PREDICTED: hydroxycarboxylic acid receptor 2-like [Nanorana parkeri]